MTSSFVAKDPDFKDPDAKVNDPDPTVSDSSFVVDNDADNDGVKDENERVDLGNHEADDDWNPPHVNDEGKLVDDDDNVVFTTTEQAVADGSLVLDAKGRMPGLYLDDIEALQRRQLSEVVEAAHEAADSTNNTLVQREVKVANSGMPPIVVMSKQENVVTGEAKDEDAEVPELEKNPIA